MVENHEYNIPAAFAALRLLRLYQSTGSRPDGISPRQLRMMASIHTGVKYKSGKDGTDTAISELAKWLKDKE
jgi:hypothetical protein